MISVKFPILANFHVFLIIANDFDAAKPAFMPDIKFHEDEAGACVTNDSVAACYLFLKPKFTLGTLSHECSHAIHHMFEYVGAKWDNEMFAYHLGYLVDKLQKEIKCRSKKEHLRKQSHKTSARNRTRVDRTLRR